jgi:hypothetical protein
MLDNIAIGIPWSAPNILWILITKGSIDIEDLKTPNWLWWSINAFKAKRSPMNKMRSRCETKVVAQFWWWKFTKL